MEVSKEQQKENDRFGWLVLVIGSHKLIVID
jgi:hypothetical protein